MVDVRRFPLLLLFLSACEPAPQNPAVDVAVPAKADAEVVKANQEPVQTVEDRRTAFEARPSVALPSSLPSRWRALPKMLDGKVTEVSDEIRTRIDQVPAWREIRLEIRLFGTDEEVDERLLSALKTLQLAGFENQLPEAPVKAGDEHWDLRRYRKMAKSEGARETRAVFFWKRQSADPEKAPKCRKPNSVDFSEAPLWLQKATAQTSTKRRVSVRYEAKPGTKTAACRLFFQIGEAHDEAIGHLRQAAKENGLRWVEGEGPRQTWQGNHGETLRLTPALGDLGLGCQIKGPVLLLEWSEP